MSDHRERACVKCGSYLHHEDACPTPPAAPALAFVCPNCGAAPGVACRAYRDGQPVPDSITGPITHMQRTWAARRAAMATDCRSCALFFGLKTDCAAGRYRSETMLELCEHFKPAPAVPAAPSEKEGARSVASRVEEVQGALGRRSPTDAELAEMFEHSKNDYWLWVGSDIRILVAEVASLRAALASEREARERAEAERDEAKAGRLASDMEAADSAQRLAAAERSLEEARGALRRVEWSFRQTALRNGGTIYTATLCPACMGEKDPPDDKGPRRRRGDPLPPAGHKPECWLAAAMSAPEPGRGGEP